MFNTSHRVSRLANAALLGLLWVVASGCSAGAPQSATPSAAGSIDSSASSISSPEPPASTAILGVTPTPSALASIAPIPNGDYVSGLVTCAMWKAIMKDPGVASDEGFQGIMSSCAGVDPSVGGRSTLRLANGRWTQFGQDGSVGDGGPYAFIDGHTVVSRTTTTAPSPTTSHSRATSSSSPHSRHRAALALSSSCKSCSGPPYGPGSPDMGIPRHFVVIALATAFVPGMRFDTGVSDQPGSSHRNSDSFGRFGHRLSPALRRHALSR